MKNRKSAMVLNLDKCIGCHTCSVTCKNVWTSRGHGIRLVQQRRDQARHRLPQGWENQDKWNGGWVRKATARSAAPGAKWKLADAHLRQPQPARDRRLLRAFTFDYDHLQSAPR